MTTTAGRPASTSPVATRRWSSARARLRDGIFPLDPVRAAGGGARTVAWVVAVLAVAAAAVVDYLRLSPRGRGAVWAEDGGRFLTEQLSAGFLDAVDQPYAGYAHLVPRSAAALAGSLPLADAETVLAGVASVVVGLSAVATYVLARGHLPGRAVRLLLSAMVVLLPLGAFETLGNVANSHWFLMAAAFWACLARPADRGRSALAALVVVLAMASDPITLVLTPLVLLRLLLLPPRWRDQVVTVAFALATVFQLLVVLGTDRAPSPSPPPGPLLLSYLVRVPFGLLTGTERENSAFELLGWGGVAATSAVFVVALAVVALRGPARLRWLASAALLASIAFYVLPTAVTWSPVFDPTGDGGVDPVTGGRYAVVPSLLLVAVLAASLQALTGRTVATVAVGALVLVTAVLAVSVVPGFRGDPDVRGGPSWDAGLAEARAGCLADPSRAEVAVPVAPGTGRWSAVVPCARLR